MAHQVADLVEQFVRLDAFLMDFIFEAALKLASLTDGQLFMMIETSEGRRYAGKEHLCALYQTGGLKPIGSEMKYHLDSYVPSISKELVDPPPPPSNNSFSHGGESDPRLSNPLSVASSMTRSLKRRNGGSSSAATSASMASPPKSARLSSSISLSTVDATNGADFAVETSTRDSKTSSAVVKTLDVKHEVDDEIFLIDDEETDGGGGVGGGDLSNSDLDFSAIDFNSTGEMHQQRHQMDLDSLNSAAFDESHDSVIHKFLELNPKAHTLSELPCESFLKKDSPSLKLLHSLGYDYCKFMSGRCPTDEDGNYLHRSFFRLSFGRFWAQFPNLEEAHQQSISLKKQLDFGGVTLKTKIRSKLYSFFLKPIAKRQGKISRPQLAPE